MQPCRNVTWSLPLCDNQYYYLIILNPFSLAYIFSCYLEMVVFQLIAPCACVYFAIFHLNDSPLRSTIIFHTQSLGS
jgi:hypothetical protein